MSWAMAERSKPPPAPDPRPESLPGMFRWTRQSPGHHSALVDGILYTITQKTAKRWELVGSIATATDRVTLLHTDSELLRDLRKYAEYHHQNTRRGGYVHLHAGAAISAAVLACLRLRMARLEITCEPQGWFAQVSVQPAGAKVVRLFGFHPTPVAALASLDRQAREALAPGGELHSDAVDFLGVHP